jgi:tRNA threonylcarbamoyladenosine biosynthesis protein TsaE
MTDLHVVDATAETVDEIVTVIHHAFAARRVLDPPSTALSENASTVGAAIAEHGGLLARIDGVPAGAMLFDVAGDVLGLRRVSVNPRFQGRGVASAMVGCAEDAARLRGLRRVRLIAREELPETVEFWRRRGYSVVEQRGHDLIYAKAMPLELTIPTADDMRSAGEEIAGQLRAGDVLVLSGDLGAGKTTFTQGLGAGRRRHGRDPRPACHPGRPAVGRDRCEPFFGEGLKCCLRSTRPVPRSPSRWPRLPVRCLPRRRPSMPCATVSCWHRRSLLLWRRPVAGHVI